MPEVWGEHKCNSHDSRFNAQLCNTFGLLVLGDILAFRVGLIYAHLPCLLLGAGKSRMAGTAPSPTQVQVPGISVGSPSQPCAAINPFLGHYSLKGAVSMSIAVLLLVMQMKWGALEQLMYPARAGLNIPQPFLFHFRDLVTEESLNLLIVIRACVFGSFPLLPDQLYYICQATPSFPRLSVLQGWT